MSIEKILITGASGYLAQFIIDQLHGEYQLTLIDLVEPDRAPAGTTFIKACLLYTSPSPRDRTRSRMPSSA